MLWLVVLLLAADIEQPAPKQDTVIVDVTSAPDRGVVTERNGVRWTTWHESGGYIERCAAAKDQSCVPETIRVRNDSSVRLVCHGVLRYDKPNGRGELRVERDMVVMPQRFAAVVRSQYRMNDGDGGLDIDCKPSPPPAPPTKRQGCAFDVEQAPEIAGYQPAASRWRLEEGTVHLDFTLENDSGAASKIAVAASSLFPEVDAAAVRALQEFRFGTSCRKQRYRIFLVFSRDDPPRTHPDSAVTSNEQGAMWTTTLRRDDDKPCDSDPRSLCGRTRIIVKNQSPVALRCDAVLRFEQPNALEKRDHREPQRDVGAGREVSLLTSFLPVDFPVKDFVAECHSSPPPPTRIPGAERCIAKMVRPANPDDFYPAESVARGEEGAPIIRVQVQPGNPKPTDVVLVESSGFAALDAAAIRTAQASRFAANCEGASVAFKVRFSLKSVGQ